MKLIILTGASDKGKSQTLNLSFNALINFGYTRFQNHFRTLGNPIKNDFIDIVERNNYRIGFATMGDYQDITNVPGDTVQELFTYLQNQQCDCIVLACNSNLNIALSFLQTHNPIMIHKQTDPNAIMHPLLNAIDAEIIYKLI